MGSATRAAYEQSVRDKKIPMPLPAIAQPSPIEFALVVLDTPPHNELLVQGGRLADCFNPDNTVKKDPQCRRRLIEEATEIWRRTPPFDPNPKFRPLMQVGREPAGYMVLQQWAKDEGPPPPITRVGLAMADIALEYVGAKPSLFGVGPNGEKLIAAVALNLQSLLPNPDDPGDWRNGFAEQAASIFFRASLKALEDNLDIVVEEDHLKELTQSVVKPLIDMFEANPGDLPSLTDFRDTVFGPMSQAAVKTLTKHQEKFLGRAFAPEKAVGAMTKVILEESVKGDLREMFGDDRLVRLYGAALGVIAEKPELFIGNSDDENMAFARDLLSSVAGTLKNAPPPFTKGLAADLAVNTLTVFSAHLPARFNNSDPWQRAAAKSVEAIIEGLIVGIQDPQKNPFEVVFSKEQAVEIVKLFIKQASVTPGMITGDGAKTELKNIVAAIARVMGRDDTNLISSEGWKEIIATALAEASKNPDTLFSIGQDDPEKHLATILIGNLLSAAAENLKTNSRKLGVVLFGEILKEATIETLRVSVRNAKAAGTEEAQKAIKTLVEGLNKLALDQAGAIGSKEWEWLFRHLIVEIIETGEVPEWTDAELIAKLYVEEAA